MRYALSMWILRGVSVTFACRMFSTFSWTVQHCSWFVEPPAVGNSRWPAQTQKSGAAQIDVYALLWQQGPIDSLIEGFDGRRLRKFRRRVLGGKPGQCWPGSSERRGRSWTRAGSKLGANEARLECWPIYGILKMICVLDGMETVELKPAVTVVDPVANVAVHEHENRLLRARVANRTQKTQMEKHVGMRCGPPSAAHCPWWPRGSGRVCVRHKSWRHRRQSITILLGELLPRIQPNELGFVPI